MNTEKTAEVIEEFKMKKPGKVYPELIKVGEIVTGRVADVAIELGCAIDRDDQSGTKPDEKSGTKPDDQSGTKPDEKSCTKPDEKSETAPNNKADAPGKNK